MKNNFLFKAVGGFLLLLCLIVPWRPAEAASDSILPSFSDFVGEVMNGQAKVVRGVFVPGILALRVEQQPVGEPGIVLKKDGVATQFRAAANNNNIGLLAHNNLAGATFSGLQVGQEVRIVYGDGRVDYYIVNRLASFQALQPDSQNGDFVDLSSKIKYTAQDIFSMFYAGSLHVTFQTCILKDGNGSWGRLFVTAVPYLSVDNRRFQLFRFEPLWSLAR
jgi:hypothetical protein